MLLENKIAVIYGAGGTIGGAVARAFAREGARVYLSGRSQGPLDVVAEEIRAAGGTAETAQVDALDEQAVNTYVDAVAEEAGGIDISFDLISTGDVHGIALVEMSLEDFMRPIVTAMRTQFLTGRAAARHMIKRGSGVILAFGGSGDTMPSIGSTQVTFDAIEGLRRQWAVELGPHGIRVVTLKTGGIAEAFPETFPGREEIVAGMEAQTLLKRTATLADVGNVAAFVASDLARTITATEVNITCGAIID